MNDDLEALRPRFDDGRVAGFNDHFDAGDGNPTPVKVSAITFIDTGTVCVASGAGRRVFLHQGDTLKRPSHDLATDAFAPMTDTAGARSWAPPCGFCSGTTFNRPLASWATNGGPTVEVDDEFMLSVTDSDGEIYPTPIRFCPMCRRLLPNPIS